MIIKNAKFCQLAQVFSGNKNNPKEDIIKAVEEALVCLFNGAEKDDLNSFRYKRYCDKVKRSSKAVEAKNFPPTSAAARYHSLRVFFQIQEWKGDVSGLEPSEWGWEEVGGQLLPNTTDLPAAQSKCLRCLDASVKQGAAHFDAHV